MRLFIKSNKNKKTFKKNIFKTKVGIVSLTSFIFIFITFLIPIDNFVKPNSFLKIKLLSFSKRLPNQISQPLQGWVNYGGSLLEISSRYLYTNVSKNIDKVEINISYKEFSKLSNKRKQAIDSGVLTRSKNDTSKASITFKNNNYNSRIRLKGDWTDHLKGQKWSYRVRTKGNKTINGMQEFSLQNPVTRNYIYEYILHKALKQEGVPSLRYDFVNLVLNGKNLGTYAMEEHFDKILIENNKYREGPIIKLSEDKLWQNRKSDLEIFNDISYMHNVLFQKNSKVLPFNKNKIIDNTPQRSQFLLASNLLYGYLDKELEPSQVFDYELMAKYYALSDLFSSSHGLIWHNSRFYFNPITGRLVPIGFDMLPSIEATSELSLDIDPHGIFKDPEFQKYYINELLKVSDKDYLDDFLKKYQKEISDSISKIQRTYPYVKLLTKELYKKQKYIKSRLILNNPITSKIFKLDDNNLDIQLANTSKFAIELSSIKFNNKIYKPLEKYILKGKKSYNSLNFKNYKFAVEETKNKQAKTNNELYIYYKKYGSNLISKQFLKPLPETNITNLNDINLANTPNSKSFEFLLHDNKNKKIFFKEGDWEINTPLITPKGYELISKGNLNLNLKEEGRIISNGPLMLRGNQDSNINIFGNNNGNGIIILNANKPSEIEYTNFIGLSALNSYSLGITGSLSFYNSPVSFNFCTFQNTNSEDALNLFRSDFLLSNSKFVNLNSDALDIDFSNGIIENSKFLKIGNDAIDVSGGNINIYNVTIKQVSDKAISAGENSFIDIKKSSIIDSGIGLASKDLSVINAFDTKMRNADLCLAAYQKKPEFGPGLIESNQRYLSCQKDYLLEPNSAILIGNKRLIFNTDNVSELLYGVEYGKESNR